MSVHVTITVGPLPPAASVPDPDPGRSGAILTFEGIVRAREGDRTIDALHYEAYRPMAEQEIHRIAADLVTKHALTSMRIEHSVGRVTVGETSFRLTIRSPHRKEALAAADEFIDRLKRDVPIWKAAAQ